MLMPDNIKPENSIYYNGAVILKELLKNHKRRILDLYSDVVLSHEMSYNIFILSLDWLYLIGAIKNKNEEVILCS